MMSGIASLRPSTTMGHLSVIAWCTFICLTWAAIVHGFNVDISAPLYFTNSDSESQFGLSLALHREGSENMLLVGAPRAESSGYSSDQNIRRSGALYKCPIDTSTTAQEDCTEIIVDTQGNEYLDRNNPDFQSTNASGQWLGSTLQSGGPDGSVVVCRPLYSYQTLDANGNVDRYLRGGCFVINGGLSSPNDGLLDTAVNFNPCADTDRVGFRTHYRCEFGGSAAVRNTRIVYGATGACLWNGRIWYTNGGINEASSLFFYPPTCRFSLNFEYYFGYAVAFGNFRGSASLEVAIGAPRWDHGYGRVFLYGDDFMKYDMIDAGDLATYFGHALAASDLNNDGFDDLVISAPMFTDEERAINAGWEVGKVYIYYNDQQGGFYVDDFDVIIGTEAGCRFGYSLAALGDINQDGFNDLAIGAPFCDGGNDGKVYIYHGSGRNLPLNLSPQQILSPSEFNRPLKFFGFVMSAGLDLDGNTYPDFAIGAHQSQTAIILRSRAVVWTNAEISPEENSLDLDVKNVTLQNGVSVTGFNVVVCLRYLGQGLPSTLDFSYEVTLDSSRQTINRRGAFIDNNMATLRGQMSASLDEGTCETHAAYIKPSIRDKQTPMTLQLIHSITETSQSGNAVPPIMSNAVSNQTQNSLVFARDCEGETCYPDLGVQTNISLTQLTIGKAETFQLDVEVTNSGEDAFLSVLNIVEPPGLFFVNVLRSSTGTIVSCSLSTTTRTRSCNIGNPISAGDQMTVGLQYQTAVYSSFTGPAQLNVSARSIDAEKAGRDADNDAAISIPVVASSSLVLSGNSIPDTLLITEDSNATVSLGSLMTHVIRLQNNGPSFIGSSIIEILWPITLQDGKTLMNVTDVTMETGIPCQLTPRINENSQRKNNITEFEDVENNATIYTLWADCDSLRECMVIQCPLNSLAIGADSAVTISVQSRLWHDAVFAEDAAFLHYIEILSTTSVTVNGTVYTGIPYSPFPTVSPLEIQTQIRVQYEGQKVIVQTTPFWIYIVSSLCGLLILILVIAILYKVKFFKRKQISQEQREILIEHRKSFRKSRAASPEPELDSPTSDDHFMEVSPLQRDGSVAGLIQ